MESNSEVWSDWIKQNNEYAINDRKAIEAGGGDYLNFIAIILQKNKFFRTKHYNLRSNMFTD